MTDQDKIPSIEEMEKGVKRMLTDPEFKKEWEEMERKSQELIDSADRHNPLDLLERYG